MRLRLASMAVTLLAPIALTTALPGVASASTGIHSYRAITVKVNGKVCRDTLINGLADNGVAVGTEYCGHDEAFSRTPSGHIALYKLPAKDAHYTLAANIASNGIVALVGSMTKNGPTKSYLRAPSGQLVQIADPKAHGRITTVNAVNRYGETVGDYCPTTKCAKEQPFIESNGKYRDFSLHISGAHRVALTGINDSEELAGEYANAKGAERGFVVVDGHVQLVTAPDAGHKRNQGTYLLALANNGSTSGEIVGTNSGEAGFVDIGGIGHLIEIGGSSRSSYRLTDVFAINDHGEIGGGSYRPKSQVELGYLAER
jgi:hypothetical protein